MIYKQNKWHFESLLEAVRIWLYKFIFRIESPSAHVRGYNFSWDMWKSSRKRGKEK